MQQLEVIEQAKTTITMEDIYTSGIGNIVSRVKRTLNRDNIVAPNTILTIGDQEHNITVAVQEKIDRAKRQFDHGEAARILPDSVEPADIYPEDTVFRCEDKAMQINFVIHSTQQKFTLLLFNFGYLEGGQKEVNKTYPLNDTGFNQVVTLMVTLAKKELISDSISEAKEKERARLTPRSRR